MPALVAGIHVCVLSMVNYWEVQVLCPARWWRRTSEARKGVPRRSGAYREVGPEESVEQNRGPMDKNRITRPTRQLRSP